MSRMPTATVREIDGALMFAIPSASSDPLGIKPGATLDINLERQGMFVKPEPESMPSYTLEELLSVGDYSRAARTPEDNQWLNSPPVGKELI